MQGEEFKKRIMENPKQFKMALHYLNIAKNI